MEEWKIVEIKDICTGIYEGPHATPKESLTGGIYLGIPAISSDGHINFDNAKRISEEDLPIWTKRVTPQEDDIVFTNEATLNLYAIIPAGFHGCLGRRLGLIRPNKNLVDVRYLFYFFFSPEWRETVSRNKVSGATVERILMTKFPHFPVKLPPLSVQKRIADILSSIDEKIAINNRINHNLLTIAQSLFNEQIAGSNSSNNDYEKGSLSDIADYLNGIPMQKYPATDSDTGIPVLKIKELGQGSCDNNSDKCSSSIPKQFIIDDGDIIFSWSGTLLVDYWCGGICGLNQHLFKVSSKKYPGWFIYFWTKYHLERFQRIAQDKAVTMGHIRRSDLEQAEVLIPDKGLLSTIDGEISPLMTEYVKRRIENRLLKEFRNSILPQLMSGDLYLTS